MEKKTTKSHLKMHDRVVLGPCYWGGAKARVAEVSGPKWMHLVILGLKA